MIKTLNKKNITPISSLKSLAISSGYNGNIMSIIPANKSSYYVGIYDNNYNELEKEACITKDEIATLCSKYNPYIVSIASNVMGKHKINKQSLDIPKIINYYKDKEKVNYFKLVPNYLKLPQALEGKK